MLHVSQWRRSRGEGLARVSPFWSDTILCYQSNRTENNYMFNIIENVSTLEWTENDLTLFVLGEGKFAPLLVILI